MHQLSWKVGPSQVEHSKLGKWPAMQADSISKYYLSGCKFGQLQRQTQSKAANNTRITIKGFTDYKLL